MSSCSHTRPKTTPEVVASCFSDGENQELYCKAQRNNEEGLIVTTRCIGTQNREAAPALRGKCVEKICSEGSNTDCQVRGEFAVLQQYAELMTSGQFVDESKSTPMKAKVRGKTKGAEIDTDPSAKLVALPVAAPEPRSSPKKVVVKEADPEPQEAMAITLKPAKQKKKNRATASVKITDEGFKKVCVDKKNVTAPEVLRGKCATRFCTSGKCSYKGRREMFDWTANSARAD